MTQEPFPLTPRRVEGQRPQRNVISVYLRDGGLEWLQGRMAEHSVKKSDVVKAALGFAAQHRAEFDAYLKERKS